MSTITRERVKDILEFGAGRIISPITDDEIMELARIALASLDAEPVYQFIYNNPYEEGYTEWLDCNKDYFNGVPEDCRRILYTAPPAPVSVPTFEEWCKRTEQKPVGWVHDAMKEAYDACRAAMLQGADGNSPVIPDGWVHCSDLMPDGMQTVITSNGFDIGQGWWDGEGWNSFDSHDVVPGDVTHWMPLPAAPHQEA